MAPRWPCGPGCPVRDVEFVQFHPTVLWRGPGSTGQQALISEAVRGEGALLYDGLGRRVMAGVHPLEDLAPATSSPRPSVGAWRRRRAAWATTSSSTPPTWGNGSTSGSPRITAACRSAGIDPAHDRIPVAPAAHYVCGGIVADLDGRTEVPGIFAVGEVACTGVHGANRLASNSLTEGVVAGTRVGRALGGRAAAGGRRCRPVPATSVNGPLLNPAERVELRSAMSRHVGVLRLPGGAAQRRPASCVALAQATTLDVTASRNAWEATNLLTVASARRGGGQARTESRGCHRRTDWPEPRDVWRTHLTVRLGADGRPVVDGVPEGA